MFVAAIGQYHQYTQNQSLLTFLFGPIAGRILGAFSVFGCLVCLLGLSPGRLFHCGVRTILCPGVGLDRGHRSHVRSVQSSTAGTGDSGAAAGVQAPATQSCLSSPTGSNRCRRNLAGMAVDRYATRTAMLGLHLADRPSCAATSLANAALLGLHAAALFVFGLTLAAYLDEPTLTRLAGTAHPQSSLLQQQISLQ